MKIRNLKLLALSAAFAVCGGQAVQAEEEDKISASLSFDINSHFMSYGVNVWGDETEDIGDEFIFNPSGQVDVALTDTMGVYAGIWMDINDIPSDEDEESVGGNIQEVDVWIGYWISVADFTFDIAYQQWYYLSETEGIVDFTVSYDTLFSPYIKAHNRIDGVDDQERGTIFELGGTLYETTVGEVDLSFPVAVAGNFDDYHVQGEDGFAYANISANFSYGLPLPDGYGAWDFHGGLTFWHTDEDNVGNTIDGSPEEDFLTLNLGIGVAF